MNVTPEARTRPPRRRKWSLYCLVISAGPLVLLRMPEHATRWTIVSKAINAMMRNEHGVLAKDIFDVEGLAGSPEPDVAAQEDLGVFERAFSGDPTALAKFSLHAWNTDEESFDMVRAAASQP